MMLKKNIISMRWPNGWKEMEMWRLDMAACEEVEGTVLAAVGRLKLIS